jgi:hypothetical protein
MAGAGFRTFVDGDVLTAAQVNTFLMEQAVMVFADAAARTTALPTPSEGMVTYLKDTDALEKYLGASWVDITADSIAKALVDAKGDIITATADNTPARLAVGTNEHRLVADSGETTGLKYVPDTTNYAIAAKGDLLAGTAADTLAALTVGTNGQVLTADSSTATGLAWAAAAAAGGKVLQVVAATHSTEVSTTGTTFIDTGLTATITPATSGSRVLVLASQTAAAFNPSGTNAGGAFRLVRNSTEVWKVGGTTNLGITIVGASATNLQNNQLLGMAYLDSPSTASAVTYKTQLRSTTATTTAQPASSTSSIVLIEIGA